MDSNWATRIGLYPDLNLFKKDIFIRGTKDNFETYH